jgi:hypothetical protein
MGNNFVSPFSYSSFPSLPHLSIWPFSPFLAKEFLHLKKYVFVCFAKITRLVWKTRTFCSETIHTSYSDGLRAGRPGDRGSIPGGRKRIFSLSPVSRPALWPTQLPVQWVPWVLSAGLKARPERDADHSPASSAEVENQ